MQVRAILLLLVLLAIAVLATCQQQRISNAERAAEQSGAAVATAEAERDAAVRAAQTERSTTRVVTQYVDRVQVVRERGATIVKEVPVYVTPTADAACAVPAGFVRLYNAAAQGIALDHASAGDPDAPAAGVTLSAVADTTAHNFGLCHERGETIAGLQHYVRELEQALQEARP
ncbi:hypothetical protein [Xanthomonas sp. 60]